ncbi:MAG: rod shape-determining protein MreD [Tannerella sp.]|jgi:rod shape-determining protein MreD|nr:rod shape-determining protein MreD [Tannerella sp.]
MIRTWFRFAVYFTVFVLLQVLVMNNIHLFNLVKPFIYIYVLLKLPVDMTRSAVILISFLLGLSVDLFSNTFGIHAAACSFAGFVRMPLLERFADIKDLPGGSIPSCRLFGYGKFMRYAFVLTVIHHFTLFVVESFTFFQPLMMTVRMISAILFSLLLIFIVEAFNPEKSKNGE